MDDQTYEVIIVGGGPAGSSAAIYAARFDLRTLVIDKGLTAGALGSSQKIHNYPGVAGPLSGVELLERMRHQAQSFGAQFLTDKVIGVNLEADPREVTTSTHGYFTKALILATGAMGRSRTIPEETRLLGRGVSYCAICDGAFFRNQAVAVVGNTEEALQEALLLTTFADRVYLLSSASVLRANPSLIDRVSSHSKIQIRLAARVQAIIGDGQVEGVKVLQGTREEILPIKGVFIYLQGTQPIIDYLQGQVETLENGCLRVDGEMQTNVTGVFAVGDLLCRHTKQAVIAAAEGAMAAVAAEKYVRGRSQLRLDWH